jgi:thioredoxin-related protein
VAYVTVSLDESKDVAMKFFGNKSEKTQQSINRSYLDASGASYAEQNGVESLPYLIMVDKQGKIVKRIKGHPSKSDLELLSKK